MSGLGVPPQATVRHGKSHFKLIKEGLRMTFGKNQLMLTAQGGVLGYARWARTAASIPPSPRELGPTHS